MYMNSHWQNNLLHIKPNSPYVKHSETAQFNQVKPSSFSTNTDVSFVRPMSSNIKIYAYASAFLSRAFLLLFLSIDCPLASEHPKILNGKWFCPGQGSSQWVGQWKITVPGCSMCVELHALLLAAERNSLGREQSKRLLWGLRLLCIFEKSGKNEATDMAVSQLRGSTIAIISAHVPGSHLWASAGPGPSSFLQNSVSRTVVLRFTTLSARDRHWRNPRERKF